MAAIFGLVGMAAYWFEDLRAPRVILDHDDLGNDTIVSIRQLQRHRKRWKARLAQLTELIGVRHEISFAIPWHEAEAALVEAQDMVADLTAAIAAINELHLRKAKITNPRHAIVFTEPIAELDNLPCPVPKPPKQAFDFTLVTRISKQQPVVF